MNKHASIRREKGAATLVVSVVLLIGVTLIALLTAKTVLVETKLMADDYRTVQASAAANYAMDYAVNYFDKGGFDQDDDDVVDTLAVPSLSSSYGGQTITATATFDNTAGTYCVPAGTTESMSTGMITAVGYSDDGEAVRTITQCVGPISLLAGDGPDMPLISRSDVAMTGNANIVNRYTNTNIWSGDAVTIGSSSSMKTYIKNSAVGTLTTAQLLDTVPANNTMLVSNRNLGNGADIIDNDPTLNSLTATDFFQNFFNVDNRETVKNLAKDIGQYYTDIGNAIGKSGIIWVEGTQSLNSNGTIGSTDSPAIMIVNGNLSASGGPTVYGLVYVVGQFNVTGTVSIVGTSIVENNSGAAGAVTGTGTLNLIYWQDFLTGADGDIPGLSAVIAGSWRDF